jgi:hypothetical protein
LINGLQYLIYAGEKELSRRLEFEKTLEYMSQQLELLETVNTLSEVETKSALVMNRATDVFAAVLKYIAANVRQKSALNWLTGIFW